MRLNELSVTELAARCGGPGIRFESGPFTVALRSDLPDFVATIRDCYGALPLLDGDRVAHFRVGVHRQKGWRGYFSSQAIFNFDGREPFAPYPLSHAFPLFEWGLNWCIATTAHNYLLLHSAVVERGGLAVILPAMPGSGKSTLCAAMVGRGWRLLSDEFGLIRSADGMVLPLPRAAPLKDGSIDVIRAFSPDSKLGPMYEKTRKGNVVHLFPPETSLARQHVPAVPSLVVFPKYKPSVDLEIKEQAPSEAFTRLVNNSFNYQVTGESGFRTLCDLVRTTRGLQLRYSDLDAAISRIEQELAQCEPLARDGC